jgi:hypothetical protein
MAAVLSDVYALGRVGLPARQPLPPMISSLSPSTSQRKGSFNRVWRNRAWRIKVGDVNESQGGLHWFKGGQ